jgi:GNAT superfamily N-acetyltransferase
MSFAAERHGRPILRTRSPPRKTACSTTVRDPRRRFLLALQSAILSAVLRGLLMPSPPGLTYRDGPPDPEHRKAIHRLLLDIFDVDVSPIDAFCLADPTYRAFSYLDAAGCVVANAATFTLKLIIAGKLVHAMGIQSVATRPEWRRRGLSHDLLQRALEWCDASARLTFLMTVIPGFYEPMGFRTVPQFAYVGGTPDVAPRAACCRRLDLNADQDRRLLARILHHRVPVSARFAVDGSAGSFVLNLFDQAELSAWYIETAQAIVVTTERSDGTLCMVDIAADRMPTLAEIVAAFANQPKQVEIHFPPDRLAWAGIPTPAQTSTVLMVRGNLPPLEPFMIPATAAF